MTEDLGGKDPGRMEEAARVAQWMERTSLPVLRREAERVFDGSDPAEAGAIAHLDAFIGAVEGKVALVPSVVRALRAAGEGEAG